MIYDIDGDKLVNRTNVVYIAASDSTISDKQFADYVCDGTNDEVEIQSAIDDLPYGGTVYFLDGNYYIDSFDANGYAVTIKASGYARTLTLKGKTENKAYASHYGCVIHVTANAYANLSSDGSYIVFGALPTAIFDVYGTTCFANNVNFENMYIMLYNSQKPVVGINGQNFGSLYCKQVGVYSEQYFYDRFAHVKPATPVVGCIGVVSVAGSNDEMARIGFDCLNVGGLHTGIQIKNADHIIMKTCTTARCVVGYDFIGNCPKTLTSINCADEGNTHLPKFSNVGHLTMIDFNIERFNADYIPDDPTGASGGAATESQNGGWKGFISYTIQGDAFNITKFFKTGSGSGFEIRNLTTGQNESIT